VEPCQPGCCSGKREPSQPTVLRTSVEGLVCTRSCLPKLRSTPRRHWVSLVERGNSPMVAAFSGAPVSLIAHLAPRIHHIIGTAVELQPLPGDVRSSSVWTQQRAPSPTSSGPA
jgi:hypothetical protein